MLGGHGVVVVWSGWAMGRRLVAPAGQLERQAETWHRRRTLGVQLEFVLGKPLQLEESLTCEFKEVKGSNPIQQIAKTADEYAVAFLNARGGSVYWGIRDVDRVVTGLALAHNDRDQLRQVVGQKLAAIAPPVAKGACDLPLHQVSKVDNNNNERVEDLYVVRLSVKPPESGGLFLTGSGEAYRKTVGGKVKLSGSGLILALLQQVQDKEERGSSESQKPGLEGLGLFPSVAHRAKVARPMLEGARILWVDDVPRNTLYERTALSACGVLVDLATSSDDASFMMGRLQPDLIISDIKRGNNPSAGLDFLAQLRADGRTVPFIFYVGEIDPSKSKPLSSFGITAHPSELLHLVFDVLERR